jgi:hypothetical protein
MEEEGQVVLVHEGTVVDGWYCDSLTCWCHVDVSYHEVVMHPQVTAEEVQQAYSFFGILLS